MAASTVRHAKTRKNTNHKALRRADKLAILEGLAPEIVIPPTPPVPLTGYRLVVQTQVYENYGSRWKAKGGNEYHLGETVGLTEMSDELERKLLAEYRHRIERKGAMYDEYIISVDWYGPHEETPEERMMREMKEWGYPDSHDPRKFFNKAAEIDESWAIYNDFLSVDGFNRPKHDWEKVA